MSQYEMQVSASIPKIRVKRRTRPNFFFLPYFLSLFWKREHRKAFLCLPPSLTQARTRTAARTAPQLGLVRERTIPIFSRKRCRWPNTEKSLSGWSRPAQSRLSSEDETQILWLQDASPEWLCWWHVRVRSPISQKEGGGGEFGKQGRGAQHMTIMRFGYKWTHEWRPGAERAQFYASFATVHQGQTIHIPYSVFASICGFCWIVYSRVRNACFNLQLNFTHFLNFLVRKMF